MSTSRHHHYLSQCYLKGFTQGNAKKSKLTVLDLKNKKKFETIPRNVGGMRDFNRVEIDGVDPEIIEKTQSDFEGKAATALKKLEETSDFSGEIKDVILELIGMLAIKSPEMREHLSKPHIQVANHIMAMTYESKERWESQVAQIKKETGEDISDGTTFEEMKDLFERGAFEVSVSKEHQIYMELLGMQRITELLHQRNWVLLKAADGAGEFITTDNPVSLTWHNPESAPFDSPGFGLPDTMVYFPVSKNLALVGEFDREDAIKEANKHLVAILNSKIIANSYQRVLASKSNFNYIAKGGAMQLGHTLV
ncbi:DUF4238 domain-containing protein [Vibrio parahaemolyticus]|uniref:DUF4238 domain-containing protein n=1 Tax=Vibrio parahaemolyticus TaxID=670 RepID=UPI00111ED10B|nr:DUF4238 domain-containing protein [Vibrio parahaemolyticus]TOJ99052.1 hypothetical protein CGI27_16505 [Vibrio parahaemolyticus]